jgi:hypothetical protein
MADKGDDVNVEAEWYSGGLEFKCTQCGNCCSGPSGYVWFDDEEAQRIADYLKMDVNTFRRRFAHARFGKWTLNEVKTERGHDCTFLRFDGQGKALCSIYGVRPLQCRTWPFWPSNLRSPRDWEESGQRCPGMRDGGQFVAIEKIRVILSENPPQL